MSSGQYFWDEQYQRYKYLIYNHSTENWEFSAWAEQNRVDSAQYASVSTSAPDQPHTVSASAAHSPSASTHQYAPQTPTGSLAYSYSTTPVSSAYSSKPTSNYQLPPPNFHNHNGAPTGPVRLHQTISPLPQLPYHNNNRHFPRGEGASINGTYTGPQTLHYEHVDPSYYVRDSTFFFEGRVFSVIMTENAGATARLPNPMDYNTSASITRVKYQDHYVHTNVRRFIVVRQRPEFCFACPVFTYSGRATTKNGVRPAEHGIAYSWGGKPQLVKNETGITKASIPVVMAPNESALNIASRIYYGIHHPIQYNVKVKEIGYLPENHVPTLIGNWREEDDREVRQSAEVTAAAGSRDPEDEDTDDDDDVNVVVAGITGTKQEVQDWRA